MSRTSSVIHTAQPKSKVPLVRSVLMGLAAMAIYGGWAYLANRSYGLAIAMKAAATQSFVSFTVTFLITFLMEALHRRASSRLGRFVAPAGGAISFTVAYTVLMHIGMDTPELLDTVLPILIFGSLYCLIYSANLVRESSTGPAVPGSR